MSDRNAMTTLTRWVLRHKKLVLGLWVVLAIAGFAAMKPAGDALSHAPSTSPAARRSTPTAASPQLYGNGGDVAPIVPVVTLPQRARRSTRPASPGSSRRRSPRSRPRCRDARVASYASTHDRAFVSKDGRTTFALVSIPARGGVDPGQAEARRRRPRSPA